MAAAAAAVIVFPLGFLVLDKSSISPSVLLLESDFNRRATLSHVNDIEMVDAVLINELCPVVTENIVI